MDNNNTFINKKLNKLKKLFPKWNISYKNCFYYIKNDHFNMTLYYKNIFINELIDIYNSIDYITEFLLLNGFENKTCYRDNFYEELSYHYINKILMIKIILQNTLYFRLEYMQIKKSYKPDKLIEKLREILDLNSLSKPVISS